MTLVIVKIKIDFSFSCICLVIDSDFCHNIVTVVSVASHADVLRLVTRSLRTSA